MTSPILVGNRAGIRLLLLVLAVICFVIFACFGAGWFTGSHPSAFLGFGLAFFAAAFIA